MVSVQHQFGTFGGFYFIIRGATNVGISLAGMPLPPTARLNLVVTQATYNPIDWLVPTLVFSVCSELSPR
jgi:hypothetical protein